MGSAKFLFILSCVALLATTWGKKYNLNQVAVCLQILAEATSDVALEALPLFHNVTQCIKYRSYMDLNSLSFLMFGMVVFNWLQSLALEVDCLWAMEDHLRAILHPHWQRIHQYQCMYLGLASKCIPK
ncbi:hypothetical protein KR032_007067 [Drosophila birchii]|nr:hypothetical protein KR032_007067 [Drosophila birchii]